MARDMRRKMYGMQTGYTLFDVLPIIVLGAVVTGATVVRALLQGFTWYNAMSDFMGFFFLIFGFFKLIKLSDFAHAYAEYDLIAQRSILYARVYPFIEIALGVLYLMHINHIALHSFVVVLMVINALGVALALCKHKEFVCACLGTVFKVPMTYVTLAEDLLMLGMAVVMILMNRY